MNKKAILLVNNTITVIIAIAGLILLFLGSWRIYTNLTHDEETEIAQTTIDLIKAKIDALEIGENTTQIVRGFESNQQWYLLGWSQNQKNRPDKCLFSCLCICKGEKNLPLLVTSEEERSNLFADACQTEGFCRDMDEYEVKSKTHEIKLLSDNDGGDPYITGCQEIIREQIEVSGAFSLMKININKRENALTIFHYSKGYIDHKDECLPAN